MHNKIAITLISALFLASTSSVFAEGGYSGGNSRLSPIYDLIEDERFEEAITEIQGELEKDADDADLWNLLAFSQRKLGRFDVALTNYQKALAIDPGHRGANEYLGELYLQMDQPEKAEERLQVLDDECFFGCKEYDKLEQAIMNYRTKSQ